MKIIIFLICLYIFLFKLDLYSYLKLNNFIPCENSHYIDIYSMNRRNEIKTNIRLAIVYPYEEIYLNVESRIYKLNNNIQSTGKTACADNELSFVRLEALQSKLAAASVLCLPINISDMVSLLSRYRKRLYRVHTSDRDTISYLVNNGYFSNDNPHNDYE